MQLTFMTIEIKNRITQMVVANYFVIVCYCNKALNVLPEAGTVDESLD